MASTTMRCMSASCHRQELFGADRRRLISPFTELARPPIQRCDVDARFRSRVTSRTQGSPASVAVHGPRRNPSLARLSAVVRAPLLLTVGLAPPNAPPDAAPLDAAVVAPDAMLDASGPGPDAAPGAELSIAITDAPDPVAASATLTYLINVTN